jgi:hypothetical protein
VIKDQAYVSSEEDRDQVYNTREDRQREAIGTETGQTRGLNFIE